MKGYKAFGKGMICRGKQYQENTVYEENGADACCQAGVMHFCENPFDTLDYYPIVDDDGEFVEIAEVEPLADVLSDGNKHATKKLRIGARLSFKDFIKAAVDVVIETTKPGKSKESDLSDNGGYGAQIGSSGYCAKIGSSGDGAQINIKGKNSVGSAIGIGSTAKGAIGNWIVLAEWVKMDGYYIPQCVKAAQIDGEIIKPDTWYRLQGGEFVEVKEDDK